MKKRKVKMDCEDCKNRIDEYIEGKLGNEDKLSFESHLHICHECHEILNLQVLADRIIKEENKVEPDFYLSGKIMSRIENLEKEHNPWLIRIFRPALATVAVAGAIMGGVLIGSISAGTADTGAPIELTLMNDAEIEFINVLAAE